MTLRLNGDSSGFTEIKAPNAAGDNSITLPTSNGGANQLLQNGGTAGALQYTDTNGGLHYDASGRLIVGTSTSVPSSTNVQSRLQVHGNDGPATFGRFSNDSTASSLYFVKSRATTVGDQAVVNNGDNIGRIAFEGSDGSALKRAAIIDAFVEGTPGSEVMPAKIRFSTNGGGSSPTPRVEIGSDGKLRLLAGCPGIDFSATQTNATGMTNETLSSYEEGDFTVTMKFGTNDTGFTFTEQFGRYTKIGDIVHLFMTVTLSAKGTATGDAFIHGLPFPVHNAGPTRACGHLTYHDRFASLNSPVILYAVNDAVRAYMYHANSASGSMTKVDSLTHSNFNSNSVFRACLTYRTDG